MKKILVITFLLILTGRMFSQSIEGKWKLVEYKDIELQNEIPVYEKEHKIDLTFNSDKSYLKEFYRYNPFDNFRSELPDINTVTDKIKKLKNKKIRVKDKYKYNESDSSLVLFRDKVEVRYKVRLDNDILVIINEIKESGNQTVLIEQKYNRVKK